MYHHERLIRTSTTIRNLDCSENTITYDFDNLWLLEKNYSDTHDTTTAPTDMYNSDDSDDITFNL